MGGTHSTAEDDDILCWGTNDDGELGRQVGESYSEPVVVPLEP